MAFSGSSEELGRSTGNTKTPSSVANNRTNAKYWTGTWFPTEDVLALWHANFEMHSKCFWDGYFGEDVDKVVAQAEKTVDGKIHLQWFVGFKIQTRAWPKLLKAMPGCHIEKCRSWDGSAAYCCKEQSRVYGPYVFGIDVKKLPSWGSIERKEMVEKKRESESKKEEARSWWKEHMEPIKLEKFLERMNLEERKPDFTEKLPLPIDF